METGEHGVFLGNAIPIALKEKHEFVTTLLPPNKEDENVLGETEYSKLNS